MPLTMSGVDQESGSFLVQPTLHRLPTTFVLAGVLQLFLRAALLAKIGCLLPTRDCLPARRISHVALFLIQACAARRHFRWHTKTYLHHGTVRINAMIAACI